MRLTSPYQRWSPNVNTQLNKYCKYNTKSTVIRRFFLDILTLQFSKTLQIYTDAFKNYIGVGLAVIIRQENHKFSLPSNTSIYIAETYAIYEALKITFSSNLDSFTIISDSLSAIKLNQSEILTLITS